MSTNIPKSISAVITRKENMLFTDNSKDECVSVCDYHDLDIPRVKKYKVIYYLNPSGPYKVVRGGQPFPVLKIMGEPYIAADINRYVCFLEPYVGHRVSRKVVNVKTRRVYEAC